MQKTQFVDFLTHVCCYGLLGRLKCVRLRSTQHLQLLLVQRFCHLLAELFLTHSAWSRRHGAEEVSLCCSCLRRVRNVTGVDDLLFRVVKLDVQLLFGGSNWITTVGGDQRLVAVEPRIGSG